MRFVCREYRWQAWRDDLFTPGSMPLANRVIDYLALKRGYDVMTLDATDAFLCETIRRVRPIFRAALRFSSVGFIGRRFRRCGRSVVEWSVRLRCFFLC